MIVILVNRNYSNGITQFDGSFVINEETVMRLGGILFEGEPTNEEIEARINDIVTSNFEDITIESITIE
jgi:hypothetical protein